MEFKIDKFENHTLIKVLEEKLDTHIAPTLKSELVLVSGNAGADKVRIGTEGAYPPFNMIDKAGKPAGFDVDIAKALCTKMGAN